MTRLTRSLFHGSNAAASITGIGYAAYKWLVPRPVSDFGISIHPAEPNWKTAHVLLSVVLIFAIGWLWHSHVMGQWRRLTKHPATTRKKTSGLLLMGLAAPMIVSAYAFQVSVDEGVRSFWSQIHLWSGVLWVLGSLQHLRSARPVLEAPLRDCRNPGEKY